MTKSELAEALSKDINVTITTGSGIVNTIIDAMTETLVKGKNIEIRDFGSFTVRHYDSYTGRNPKTGKEAQVKPKKLPFFKVGRDLKKAVNGGKV